jgi:nitroreductase
MADILTHIMQRRSIRKFTSAPVSAADLDVLLRAAMAAPSASNCKPWEFVVVTEAMILERLRKGLVLGRYNAPAAIVVCGNMRRALPAPVREFWMQDCSAAAQNLLLASAGTGFGSVWVGIYPIVPFIRWVAKVLGLPRYIVPLGLVWIGYPAEIKQPRTQYDARRVHWQRYAKTVDDDELPPDDQAPQAADLQGE